MNGIACSTEGRYGVIRPWMKMVANLKSGPRQQELPDHEELLLDYAVRLRKHLSGRRAVHLHFSKLLLANRRGQNLRNAAGFFKSLLRDCEGQRFILMNQDMIVILKGASTIASIDAPAIVAASGCAPPMPPRPAVNTQRPARIPS